MATDRPQAHDRQEDMGLLTTLAAVLVDGAVAGIGLIVAAMLVNWAATALIGVPPARASEVPPITNEVWQQLPAASGETESFNSEHIYPCNVLEFVDVEPLQSLRCHPVHDVEPEEQIPLLVHMPGVAEEERIASLLPRVLSDMRSM